MNRILTLKGSSYFHKNNLLIAYTITIRKSDRKIISVYPCKPPGDCDALANNNELSLDQPGKTSCLIYDNRPSTCKLFPFVMRIYHKNPPTPKEIEDSLRKEEEGHIIERLKPYIHKLDRGRWVFLGHRKKDFCQGYDRGPIWNKDQIKYFIMNNYYLHENTKNLLAETNNSIQDNLTMDNEVRMERFFNKDILLFEDEEAEIWICWAQQQNIYDLISKNTMIESLPQLKYLNEPL